MVYKISTWKTRSSAKKSRSTKMVVLTCCLFSCPATSLVHRDDLFSEGFSVIHFGFSGFVSCVLLCARVLGCFLIKVQDQTHHQKDEMCIDVPSSLSYQVSPLRSTMIGCFLCHCLLPPARTSVHYFSASCSDCVCKLP